MDMKKTACFLLILLIVSLLMGYALLSCLSGTPEIESATGDGETLAGGVFNESLIDWEEAFANTPVYDTVDYDIDGDGTVETCILSYGLTSGFFTFVFTVKSGDTVELYSVFNTRFYVLSFALDADGTPTVQGITQATQDTESETHIFDISLRDGHIILTRRGEDSEELAHW